MFYFDEARRAGQIASSNLREKPPTLPHAFLLDRIGACCYESPVYQFLKGIRVSTTLGSGFDTSSLRKSIRTARIANSRWGVEPTLTESKYASGCISKMNLKKGKSIDAPCLNSISLIVFGREIKRHSCSSSKVLLFSSIAIRVANARHPPNCSDPHSFELANRSLNSLISRFTSSSWSADVYTHGTK